MSRRTFSISRDYNRTLNGPVRWIHGAWAALDRVFGPWGRWANDGARRWWVVPAIVAVALLTVLLPIDGAAARAAARIRLGGDVRRELETIQQFGQGAFLAIIAAGIWLVDPARRRRLWDLAAASGATGLAVTAIKVFVGRPRPRPEFADPLHFLGPFGMYPVNETAGVRHAWEFWGGISSDLWSMPSSHTAYAVVTAVFLGVLYPRLKPLVIALAVVVGVARVVLRAHYPSDVAVGACAAWAIAPRAVGQQWGQRLVAGLARAARPTISP